jgi:energy-coupling factor transporter ATP-binding protein EcfA2
VFLRKLSLRNFKSAAEADLELSQLTLLVGPNSAGKSTILQALLLQAQAAESEVAGSLYPLNGSRVSLGDFAELLWSGAEQVDSEPFITIEGQLEIVRDDVQQVMYPDDTIPGWSWRIALGQPGPESASIALVRETAVWSRDDSFSLSAEVTADSFSPRLAPPRLVGVDDRDQDRWLLDVVGQINDTHGDLSEPVVGVEVIAGLPHRVLVERVASEVLAAGWIFAFERAIRLEQTRRTRGSGPDRRMVRDLDVLRRRLERAQEAGDEQQVAEFERRIATVRSRLSSESSESATHESDISPEQLSRDLFEWAHADIERLLGETEDLSTARVRFYEYFLQRRKRQSLLDWSSVTRSELHQAAVSAASRLADFTVYAPLDDPTMSEAPFASGLLGYLGESIHYLGPIRESPKPLYAQVANPRAGDIGPKGESTAAVIHACRDQLVVNPSIDGPPTTVTLLEALSGTTVLQDEPATGWLGYLGLGEAIQTADRGRLGIELTIYQPRAKRDLDLTAVGVGVSQTLPVLTLCLLSPPESLILLEHPELHLHPGAQQRLADFLLACARSGRQLIVETHSDHLMSRLRRRIAEDETNETLRSVGIVFAEPQSDRTSYRQVSSSQYGATDKWPEGFFDQTVKESQEILRAALAKKRALSAMPSEGDPTA